MLDRQAHDSSTSDRDLIALAAAGDHGAFERLVERHAAAVLRMATVVTGNPTMTEDALQQTFLSAYRGAASVRADASARTWLLTIARNAGYRLRLAAALRRESEQMEPVRLDVMARLLERVRQMGNES